MTQTANINAGACWAGPPCHASDGDGGESSAAAKSSFGSLLSGQLETAPDASGAQPPHGASPTQPPAPSAPPPPSTETSALPVDPSVVSDPPAELDVPLSEPVARAAPSSSPALPEIEQSAALVPGVAPAAAQASGRAVPATPAAGEPSASAALLPGAPPSSPVVSRSSPGEHVVEDPASVARTSSVTPPVPATGGPRRAVGTEAPPGAAAMPARAAAPAAPPGSQTRLEPGASRFNDAMSSRLASPAPALAGGEAGASPSTLAAGAGALAPLSSAAATASDGAAGSAPLRQALDLHLGSPAWGSAFGARVVWNVGQGVHHASLELNPRDLGPVNVQISVRDDEVSLAFTAQHAAVRDAIEAALPRLRELMTSGGFDLAGVEISADAREDGRGREAAPGGERAAAGDEDAAPAETAGETHVRLADGLVDTFV